MDRNHDTHHETMNDTLTLRAYAKVNLALSVGSVDLQTGLHPICSLMHAIDLFDDIELRKLPDSQESTYSIGWARDGECDEPVEWSIEHDLAVRAHKTMQIAVGRALPVEIRVSKSIPAGGGLGGGSADAAVVLMGVNTLFDLGLSHTQLVNLASTLGSDIPFFIDLQDREHLIPRPAIVEGVGDQITRLSRSHAGLPVALIVPAYGCHTGQVYNAFDGLDESLQIIQPDRVHELARQTQIEGDALFNQLEPAARVVSAELGVLQDQVSETINQRVNVSGSGSTLFVLGEIDLELIRGTCPRCRVIQTHLI